MLSATLYQYVIIIIYKERSPLWKCYDETTPHNNPPEHLLPGAKRRPLLLKPGLREKSAEFELLTSTISHLPALMAIGEC